MSTSAKRKHKEDPDPYPEGFTATFLCSLIRNVGGQSVGEFILDMARNENLTLEDLKSLTEKLPSFAKADWEKVAPSFGLDPGIDKYQFEPFSLPHAYLPPSFHERVMTDAIQWLDVYQERGTQRREAARVRLMDAWHVPVCALFKGRVVDKPEKPMPGTSQTSGGEVEHEVYMLQGIILLVVELKLAFKDELDHIAQVLLELASAYKINNDKDFEPQPPVYAVLTDLKEFYFFSYDGSSFKMDKEIHVYGATRAQFFDGMADVTERLFSTILHGYLSILNAVIDRSKTRETIGDVSTHNSAQSGKPTPPHSRKPGTARPSLDNWNKAAIKAREAQSILVGCDCSSLEVWENTGQQGLLCLQESVSYLTKVGSLTDWDQQQIKHEIHKVLLGRRKPRGEAAE